jgi:hypothetical protein
MYILGLLPMLKLKPQGWDKTFKNWYKWNYLNFKTFGRRAIRRDLGKGARVDLYLKDNIAIELYNKYFYVEIYYERNTTERLYKRHSNKASYWTNIWIESI